MKLFFDCDGTILDSMHIWLEPIAKLLKEYDYKLTTEEKGKSFMPTVFIPNFLADFTA